jgi:NACHT domain
MFRSSDYSELAGSLATVAIASLGGPMSAVGAVLAGVVKHAQAGYEVAAPTRDLRRQVSAGMRQWAESEKFTTEQVNLGLALAVESVARFGPDASVIAALNFDPQGASRRVLDQAMAQDSYWGKEDHYEVAARAIKETYRILIEQFQASEKVLLPAIQALRSSIEDYTSRVEASNRSTLTTLDDLVSALITAGTVAEVMAYLRSRIVDWDLSVWHPDQQTPSALERRLRVRTGLKPSTGDPEMSAEDALAGQRMLVVLGDPGSGKTWLAHRYAREAAQAALSRLEDGADLDEVELPLFTTWDQWTKTLGSTRQSLTVASFASGLGHSDLEWGDSIGRLQRTFTRQGTKVLLILDSLDEAVDHAGQASRLYEVTAMPGWRVVVTSRPAAWDATYRGDPDRPDGPMVVQLLDLTYPVDVDSFIRAWFAKDPGRGAALITQIRDRPDLAQVAVVPLMLTFYCLLTEPPAPADQPLPAHRRDLYQRLVPRLLLGKWVPNAPAAPDLEYCVDLLTDWAWHAVQDCITPTELGDWGDSFQQPTRPRDDQRRAIDHVAPKVMVDDEGRITRRFVHRTVLEHFVAEHIATLEADEAARILLPHLWFDPDWKVVAPAAIAAHNRRQRGALLGQLLDKAVQPAKDPAKDPARQAASSELDRLLLAIAEQSEPGDWTSDHSGLFHACRERNATRELAAVAGTAHWNLSNQKVLTALLDALPTALPWKVRDLVTALPALVTTESDRAEARTALLNALPTAEPWAVRDLVAGLPALEPTEADRAEARTALLNALPTAESWVLGDLVAGLPALVTTEADRAEARTALLHALPTAEPWSARVLVAGLPALVTTEADRVEARTALLNALPTAKPWAVDNLVTLLPALVTTEADRAKVRSALLMALPTAERWVVGDLVAVLPALEPTEADRAEARSALLNALPTAQRGVSRDLLAALPALEPTEADRAEARSALLKVLPTAEPWVARDLVALLPALEPTEADRAEARSALLKALPTAKPGTVGDLVAALRALEPTEADRAEARSALLNALPTAKPGTVGDLVAVLPALVTTEADRAEVRSALLMALPTAERWAVGDLVAVLPALEPTEADRAEARSALLNALPTAKPGTVGDLMAALRALVTTEADRAEVRSALLMSLPTAKPWAVRDLLALLRALVTTEADRAEARTALLMALPTAERGVVRDLVALLPALEPTEADRAEARTALLMALLTAKRGVVRDLVALLPALVTTEADRAQARTALLMALPTAKRGVVRVLLAGLPALVTTEADRAEARSALLNALPTAKRGAVGVLVAGLPALEPTEADRAKACSALLNALPTAEPWAVGDLVAVLPAMVTTEADRAEARSALLNALPTAKLDAVRYLLAVLPALATTEADLAEARTTLLNALPTAEPWVVGDLVAGLRSVSPVQSWLAWLANRAIPSST